jgi:glutathione S-transferase
MTISIDRDTYYRLYGSEVSYFTAKVRPALRYKRVPFVEILATPAAFRDVIRPRTGLAFIPVIVTPDDETWQDTSVILDHLEERFPDPPLVPVSPVQRVVANLFELYADEFLPLPAMHYRWNFPESVAKARADFAATSGDPETASKFADRMGGSIAFLGVLPETIPAIEAHTADLLQRLSDHLAAQPYLLGGRPSLAEMGMIGPLYAHLYLDAVPGRLLRETAPRVCHWIERVNHPDPDDGGEWLAGDALAPTLRPLLELIGADAVPLILDTLRDFESWAADNRPVNPEPPRATGMHSTRLRGVAFQRYTSPYTLWMVQRTLDAYHGLDATRRAAVDAAVAGTGIEALLAFTPAQRVEKRGFRLAFV